MKKTNQGSRKELPNKALFFVFLAIIVSANVMDAFATEKYHLSESSFRSAYLKAPTADTFTVGGVTNGDFSTGFEHWNSSIWGDAKGSFTVENGMAKLTVDSAGTYTYNIMLYQGVSLNSNTDYILSFDIKSDTPNRPFEIVLEHYGIPYNKYLWEKTTTSENANEIKHFEVKIKLDKEDLKTKLGFHFGSHKYGTGTVWIGNISIRQ
jgi:hypothetical protein